MTKHTATPWQACGSAILSGGDAIQQRVIAVTHYPDMIAPASMAEREANKRFIIIACNSHDQLVAALKLAKEFEQHAGGTHLPASAWFALHETINAALNAAGVP